MRFEETQSSTSSTSGAGARCPECEWVGGQHHPNCSQPLRVEKFPEDSDEEFRMAISLEGRNARAAGWLLARGMNPHAYRAGGLR